MKKSYRVTVYVLLAFWAGYEAHNNKVFPIGRFIERNFFEKEVVTKLQKKVHAYVDVSNKSEVSCPVEDDAYIIIGFGQSNSANYAGHRFEINKDIVNFYNGKCYVANDPLLGATGRSGSVWIPLSEQLEIKDLSVLKSSQNKTHQIIYFTGNKAHKVFGILFSVTKKDLLKLIAMKLRIIREPWFLIKFGKKAGFT